MTYTRMWFGRSYRWVWKILTPFKYGSPCTCFYTFTGRTRSDDILVYYISDICLFYEEENVLDWLVAKDNSHRQSKWYIILYLLFISFHIFVVTESIYWSYDI